MTAIYSAIPASAAAMVDDEYLATFEEERSKSLRRRFTWYCAIAIVGIATTAVWNTSALIGRLDEGEGARQSTALDLAGDLALLILYGSALVTVRLRKLDRRGLVSLLTWLTVLVSTVAVVVTPLANYLDMEGDSAGYGPEHFTLFTGIMGLLAVFLLNTVGSLLIALSPKELLRLFMPTWLVYSLVMLVLHDSSATVRVILILLFPLAGIPGMGWSLWRYRRFGEVFHSRIMNERYGEIVHELAYARRIHEALFPPPIEKGAIRVAYRYSPMREIGGDFLFVHPLTFPPSEPSGPLSIVLIDVSGHGVPAALAVNRLHGELQRFFAMHPNGSPGELVSELNRYAFYALAPQGVYATALVLRADPDTRRVQWVGAGHPAAFLRSERRPLVDLAPAATMLGVIEPDAYDAQQQDAPFEPGDRIVAFTDGAFEARDAARQEFGIDRIREIVASPGIPPTVIGRLANSVIEAVMRHRRGKVTDDILIVEVAAIDMISGADLMLSIRSQKPLDEPAVPLEGRR